MKPDRVIILSKEYTITYLDNPAEVDLYKRRSLWGEVDLWTRTIRVYDNGRTVADLWETILHEVIHALSEELHIPGLHGDCHEKEEAVDLLGLALADTLLRNGWLKE